MFVDLSWCTSDGKEIKIVFGCADSCQGGPACKRTLVASGVAAQQQVKISSLDFYPPHCKAEIWLSVMLYYNDKKYIWR